MSLNKNQCLGITKNSTRCTRLLNNSQTYCFQHKSASSEVETNIVNDLTSDKHNNSKIWDEYFGKTRFDSNIDVNTNLRNNFFNEILYLPNTDFKNELELYAGLEPELESESELELELESELNLKLNLKLNSKLESELKLNSESKSKVVPYTGPYTDTIITFEDITETDEKGQPEIFNVKTIITYYNEMIDGKLIKSALKKEKFTEPNNIKILEETYLNNELNGIRYTWFLNEALKSKQTYKDGKLIGKQYNYFLDGTINLEQNFYNGIQDGVQFGYYDTSNYTQFSNGNKFKLRKFIANYKKGKLDKRQEYWYENGEKMYVENYINGLKNGPQTYWYENGNKRVSYNYKISFEYYKGTKIFNSEKPIDILDGVQEYWYMNGDKTKDIYYENGIKVQEVRYIYTSNKKVKTVILKL